MYGWWMHFTVIFSIDDARYVMILIRIVCFLIEMNTNVGTHATEIEMENIGQAF